MAQDSFSVTHSFRGPTVVVHVVGEVDWAASPQVEQVFEAAVEESTAGVVADYTQVTFMDSTGLRALLRTQAELASDGRALAVCATEWPVRNLFDIAGVDALLRLQDSLDAAFDAVS